jgi:hypothetical protein
MKQILFGKKRWLVKQLTGFCAVGRMMKIRKAWSHDLCPLCLRPDETSDHVLLCKDPRAHLQWIRSVDKLGVALVKIGTDPAIANLIRKCLVLLRSKNPQRFLLPAHLKTTTKQAVVQQDAIGWVQFVRGRLAKQWEDAQEKWIISQSTKWKRSSTRWMEKLIRAVWELSQEMWEHRNGVRHHPSHPWNIKKLRDLDKSIQQEFNLFQDGSEFLPKDRRLFRSTAPHMIKEHSEEQKEQWLQSVDMARLRKMQTQVLAMTNSRLFMQNCLRPGVEPAEEEDPMRE